MQTHLRFTKVFMLAACSCSLPTHAQQRAMTKTDQQIVLSCVAAGVVCYSLNSYLATQKETQILEEHLYGVDQLTQKYQSIPEAYTEEQLAQRAIPASGGNHTLHEERNKIIKDLQRLEQMQKYLHKQATAQQKIDLLLKKLHSLENNISLAIAPFDLKVCIAQYTQQFGAMLAGKDAHSLHGHISHRYQNNLYPYLACSQDIKNALDALKKLQQKVDQKHALYATSEIFCKELHALYSCIIALPIYHEQTRQKLHDEQRAHSLELQSKQLKSAQKQNEHLAKIETHLQNLVTKHDKEIDLCLQHLNTFNLLTAQHNAHNTPPEQKALAQQRLFAQAIQSAREACTLLNLQKQELPIVQRVQKDYYHNLNEKIEHLKAEVNELMQKQMASYSHDNPGAPSHFATEPSAPSAFVPTMQSMPESPVSPGVPASGNYPQLDSQEGQEHSPQ